MFFSIPHEAEGAPSFAESAVLVYALGAKGGPCDDRFLHSSSYNNRPCPKDCSVFTILATGISLRVVVTGVRNSWTRLRHDT